MKKVFKLWKLVKIVMLLGFRVPPIKHFCVGFWLILLRDMDFAGIAILFCVQSHEDKYLYHMYHENYDLFLEEEEEEKERDAVY